MSRKRWLLAAAVALVPPLLFALGLTVAWAIWDGTVSARLRKRLEAIREAGDPVTMAQLAEQYPPLPAERNAAPLYEEAFAKIHEPEGEENEALPVVGGAELPDPTEPLPPAMVEAVRAHLAAHAEALELLHRAAAIGEARFELDFAQGWKMELPHLSRLRQAAKLFSLEAIERTERGEAEAAARSLVARLRVGRAIREPVAVSGIVRQACDSGALARLERWLVRATPSVEALRSVEAALAEAADPTLFERMLVGERCFGIDAYHRFLLTPGGGGLAAMSYEDQDGSRPLGERLIPGAWWKQDLIHYIDFVNPLVEATRLDYPQSLIQGVQRAKRMTGEPMSKPRPPSVCRMLLPATGRMFTDAQEHMARLESARVALAALRYRAANGRLPESLDALVPRFIEAVPPDPFDGRPLRYRTRGEAFVVYAVGTNRKDDGGRLKREEHEYSDPDVGFGVRWRADDPPSPPKPSGGARDRF